MNTFNKRKLGFLVSIGGILGCILVAYQNFTPGEPLKKDRAEVLSDAVSAALLTAEKDHTANQVALSVEPNQVEKTSFKRNQTKKVIVVNTELEVDEEAGTRLPAEVDSAELKEATDNLDDISPL